MSVTTKLGRTFYRSATNGAPDVLLRVTDIFATGIGWVSLRVARGSLLDVRLAGGEVLAFDTGGSREVMARVEDSRSRSTGCPTVAVATTPTGVMVGPDLARYGASGSRSTRSSSTLRPGVGDMPGSMPWEERKPGSSPSCC